MAGLLDSGFRGVTLLALSILLTAAMVAGIAGYRIAGGEEQTLIPWGMMVVGYVFFAIMSGGIADSAIIRVYAERKTADVKAFKRSLYTALAVLVPGIILVFSDILHPGNSAWFYLGFNPKSRIAWNAILYLVYGASLAALLVALIRGASLEDGRVKALAAATLLASINLEMNLGMAFGSNIAVPIWYGVYSGLLFVASAFALGAAWETVTSHWRLRGVLEPVEADERVRSYSAELALALLAVGFIVLWGVLGLYSWGIASTYVHELVAGEMAAFFWGGYVLLGLIAPLALLALARRGGFNVNYARLAGVLAVAGLAILLAVPYNYGGQVHRVSELATYNALAETVGFHASIKSYLASVESLAFIGAFGLAVLLEVVGEKLLPLKPGERPSRLYILK